MNYNIEKKKSKLDAAKRTKKEKKTQTSYNFLKGLLHLYFIYL